MGDVANTLGINGKSIQFEGREFTLAPMTYAMQAEFESWLEDRAYATVERRKDSITDAEYDKRIDRVERRIDSGVYSFGGKVCGQIAVTLPGVKELLRISLFKNHPEVNNAFVDRLLEAKMQEAQKALVRVNHDPLPVSPADVAGVCLTKTL